MRAQVITDEQNSLLRPVFRDQCHPDLDASSLSIELTRTPKKIPPVTDLKFGSHTTDHMLLVHWNAQTGWQNPEIRPYQNLQLDPTASVLHYGLECFEGLKAFRDSDNVVRLFRPEKNMSRLSRSAERIALPAVDGSQLLALIQRLVLLDERFIPRQKGYSLYIRPCIIGTNSGLGIAAPTSALLFVVMSPVGPYFNKGHKAISLQAANASEAVRAWPGGIGDKKVGGNYAPCILPELNSRLMGYQQVLWLLGAEERVTEVGAMNFFVVLQRPEMGGLELVTAPLDGTILDGVNRDCVLTLARERLCPEIWTVSERYYTIVDLFQAAAGGHLVEAFGTGTAAVVTSVRSIRWRGMQITCGIGGDEEEGDLTKTVRSWIESIQYGEEEHPWSLPISRLVGK